MNPRYTTKLSDEDIHPTPLIGAWVDWTLGGAVRQLPTATLYSVLVGCAGIIGRKYTFEGLYANQYVLALAPSGSGKDRLLRSIEEVYDCVGIPDFMGGSSWGSGQGMLTALQYAPHRVWLVDEISSQLEKISRNGADSYYAEVMSLLLRLYNCGVERGREKADGKENDITEPYICLFGMSQPSKAWPVLANMFSSGMMGRFLVCQAENDADTNKNHGAYKLANPRPPAGMIQTIKDYIVWSQPMTRVAKVAGGSIQSVEMGITADGRMALSEAVDADDAERKLHIGDDAWANANARNYATVVKLAMLYAWSENPTAAVISRKGVEWAGRVLRASQRTVNEGIATTTFSEHLESQSSIIQNYIKANSPVQQKDLYLRFRSMKNYKVLIDDLVIHGVVNRAVNQSKGPGRPGYTLTYVKDQHHV